MMRRKTYEPPMDDKWYGLPYGTRKALERDAQMANKNKRRRMRKVKRRMPRER